MVEVVLSLAAYLNLQLNFNGRLEANHTFFFFKFMFLEAFQTLKLDK
jgi:hypothetical protein